MDCQAIENILADCLRRKFAKYKPEPNAMPFHVRLLGQDRLALYQFIHSLNTSFGTSVFEPVAQAIAKPRFKNVSLKYKVGNQISAMAESAITLIMRELSVASRAPNKAEELLAIKQVAILEPLQTVKLTVVDLCVEDDAGNLYLFDIKTAKPNSNEYKRYKHTLLEWAAAAMFTHPDKQIHTAIAIPYNPYAPEPYQRWTMRGMLDAETEVKVAEEFWDFLGGAGAYEELLGCFERVGIEMREEIDAYFGKYR